MAKRNFANVFAAPSVRRARRRKVIENALLRGGLLRFGARNLALAQITTGENYADNALTMPAGVVSSLQV